MPHGSHGHDKDDHYHSMEKPTQADQDALNTAIRGECDSHPSPGKSKGQEEKEYKAAMCKLKLVSFVSVFFIIAQCIGGYLANSIAIFTDTAHLATDLIGFAMSITALNLSMKSADQKLTFGWHRAEIIGTLMSIVFLVTITLFLLKEAIGRVKNPQEVKGYEMLITAVAGLFFNLIQMSILHQGEGHYHLGGDDHDHDHDHGHGHDHDHGDHDHDHDHDHGPKKESNINVDAAFCHALSDMIMSIGVIIAAVVIFFKPEWTYADPICTFVFSIIVCVTVGPITKKCVIVLMEGAPDKIDMNKLLQKFKEVDPDMHVHDFHVWSISQGRYRMSAHIRTTKGTQSVLNQVTKIAKGDPFHIGSVTIQMEDGNEM